MIGDIVFPEPHHTAAAEAIAGLVADGVAEKRRAITIAGESGAGKSEIAQELSRIFAGEIDVPRAVDLMNQRLDQLMKDGGYY